MQKIRSEILNDIKSATSSIKIAVSWITDNVLLNALSEKIQHTPNCQLEIIMSNHKDNDKQKDKFITLARQGAKIYAWGSSNAQTGKFMHCKFYIIDDKTAKSGSYNWSNSARSNAECLDVVDTNKKLILFGMLKRSAKQYIII